MEENDSSDETQEIVDPAAPPATDAPAASDQADGATQEPKAEDEKEPAPI